MRDCIEAHYSVTLSLLTSKKINFFLFFLFCFPLRTALAGSIYTGRLWRTNSEPCSNSPVHFFFFSFNRGNPSSGRQLSGYAHIAIFFLSEKLKRWLVKYTEKPASLLHCRTQPSPPSLLVSHSQKTREWERDCSAVGGKRRWAAKN